MDEGRMILAVHLGISIYFLSQNNYLIHTLTHVWVTMDFFAMHKFDCLDKRFQQAHFEIDIFYYNILKSIMI